MSYDIAVGEGERPATDEAALETYNEMWARYEDTEEAASPRILSYIDELIAKYPDLDDQPTTTSTIRRGLTARSRGT